MAQRTRSSSRQAALQPNLFAAIAAGDPSTVQQLLNKGASANAVAGGGVTPLHAAVKAGRVRVVQVLLLAGADVNALTDEGITPLVQTVRVVACRSCPGVIKQLVRAGAVLELNLPDGASSTVLHAAAADGQLAALQALLDAGCDPSLVDARNRTPLWYAIEHCQEAAAAKLIRAGAALNSYPQQLLLPDAEPVKPFHKLISYFKFLSEWPYSVPLAHAARTGSESMVRLLIKKGARTASAIYCLIKLQGIAEEVAALLEAAAAAESGAQQQASMQALCEVQRLWGPQWATALSLLVHAEGSELCGFTALHMAAMSGDVGVVDVLLRHRAAVNAVTEASPDSPDGSTGKTPLEVAAFAAVAALSECRAGTGGTAQQHAHAAVMRRLLEAGAAATGLAAIAAASAGLDGVLQLMLRQGYNVNTVAPYGMNVLHAALTGGLSADTVRQLLAAGADVSAATCDGLTPLHCAAGKARADCAQLLLEAGAEVDARAAGLGNCTPMHKVAAAPAGPTPTQAVGSSTSVQPTPEQQHAQQAALEAARSTVQVLLDHGADINALDGNGRTPLQAAICARNVPAVQALLEAGADPSATTEAACIPVVLAVQTRQADVLRLLLQHKVPVNELYSCFDTASMKHQVPLLALAVDYRSPAMVEVLLQFGAEVNVESAVLGLPLLHAIHLGEYDIVRQLLAAGASVHAQSERWPCPLLKAMQSRNLRMLQMLLQAGADPHAKLTLRGYPQSHTPLELAAGAGHMGMVHELLVATGAHRASWEWVYPAVVAAMNNGHAGVARQLLAVHPPAEPTSWLLQTLLNCWKLGQSRQHQDISAQLRLHVYKKARWLSGADEDNFDPSTAITKVFVALQGQGTRVDRAAASLALLRGWSADVSQAEAAHRVLSVQEQQVALARVGVQHLLLLVAAAHKAHAS